MKYRPWVHVCWTFFLLLLLTACPAKHSPVDFNNESPQKTTSYLNKLSFHLKGVPPSQTEVNALLQSKDHKKFLDNKVEEYLVSPNFTQKMSNYMDELFKNAVVTTPKKNQIQGRNTEKYETSNSMNSLFSKIIENNLSWDSLITATDYKAYGQDSRPDSSVVSDYRFFRDLFPEIIPEDYSRTNPAYDGDIIDIHAKTQVQKNALAGAITTARFFRRFPTTPSNANRRRAAEVYRIFLCDDMSLTVKPSEDADLELKKVAMGIDQNLLVAGSHGNAKSCVGCHYKLEPVASLFMPYKKYLKAKVGTGALKFTRGSSRVSIEIKNGLNELGRTIVKQDEYLSCQSKHFWNWFIGKDVPLSRQRLKEISQKFNGLSRKPKDFVRYLVKSKEFRSDYFDNLNEDITFSKVYTHVFKQCLECHSNQAPNAIPSLNDKGLSSKDLLLSIRSLDLKHFNDPNGNFNPTMPPPLYNWANRSNDYKLLLTWIKKGAPNQSGIPLLNKDQTKSIVLDHHKQLIQKKTKLNSTNFFENQHYRIMRNHDWYFTLKKIFPGHSKADIKLSCREPSRDKSSPNRIDLGFHFYQAGQPINKNINTGLLSWLFSCTTQYVKSIEKNSPQALFPKKMTFENPRSLLKKPWSHLNDNLKKQIIQHQVDSRLFLLQFSSKKRSKEIHDTISSTLNKTQNLDALGVIILINITLVNLPEFTNY